MNTQVAFKRLVHMHSCVIGAGVIGITTAYELLLAGHQVSLIEEHPVPGQGSSYGNGAQLSYSYVAPLADASIWKKWPEYLFSPQSPLSLKPQWDLELWRWLGEFLQACNTKAARAGSAHLLSLAQLSRNVLAQISASHTLDFQHLTAGKLVMLSDRAAVDAAEAQIKFQAQFACHQSLLDVTECTKIEPALTDARDKWVAGVYTPSEEVGDCASFCSALLAIMRTSPNFEFMANTCVTSGEVRADRLRQIVVRREGREISLSADHFIVAMGVESTAFVKRLGFRIPVYPLKGYSITVPLSGLPRDVAPQVSVTDLSRKIVYARLGDRLRVAGRVELVGKNLDVSPTAIQELAAATVELFPGVSRACHPDQLSPWAGLRPATPTGLPIIGATPLKNLFLNVGHGALGWTLACGSARLLREQICQQELSIDRSAFSL